MAVFSVDIIKLKVAPVSKVAIEKLTTHFVPISARQLLSQPQAQCYHHSKACRLS